MTAPAPTARSFTVRGLFWAAVYVWVVGAVLVLIFGVAVWLFGSRGQPITEVIRAALTWPAYFVAGVVR